MADLTAGSIPSYANVPNGGVALIAASSNIVTLGSDSSGVAAYTAGTKGGRVYFLGASTNDTVAVNVLLYILNGASVRPLGIINVPLSSGNVANTLNVNMLDSNVLKGFPVDAAGNRYITLMPNEVLKCGSLAGLTSAKTCWVTALGSDYQA